jgi:hypothetical protein
MRWSIVLRLPAQIALPVLALVRLFGIAWYSQILKLILKSVKNTDSSFFVPRIIDKRKK